MSGQPRVARLERSDGRGKRRQRAPTAAPKAHGLRPVGLSPFSSLLSTLYSVSPISSFHSSGRLAMNSSISRRHSALSTTSSSTPRDRTYSSGP